MLQLSPAVVKDEYLKNNGQDAMLGDKQVKIECECVNGRSGSYMRGFKFTSITYGILEYRRYTPKGTFKGTQYSADHGKTWHLDVKTAKKSKGKTILARTSNKEFAFDSIQQLNRQYEGPGYKWKP